MTAGDVGAVPTALMLVGGAGAVIGTAAALSGRAARHPELPTQRWSVPLPASLGRVADARTTRVLLRGVGLVATISGIIALAGRDTRADGLVVLPVLTVVSLVAGPVYRLVNPVRAFAARPTGVPTDRDGWLTPRSNPGVHAAAVWLIGLCVVALSTHDPDLLAATAGGYVLLQALLARRGLHDQGHGDPFETLADLLGLLAPIGRDGDRRLAWRNPLVAVSHAALPPGAVGFAAVVIAASLVHAAWAHPAWRSDLDVLGSAAPTVLFGMALAIVAGVLRVCMIRPFFRSAAVPLVAAYGVVAAGRWWPPADLLDFVVLHVVAVGVLHRQALARHDLRTARAMQFPLRVAVVASVVGGLALLVGP